MKKNIGLLLFFATFCQAQNVITLTGSTFGFKDGNINEALFGGPNSLLIYSGYVYVVESDGANAIRKIDLKKNEVTTVVGNASVGFVNGKSTTVRFFHPVACTADDKGNIYVTDFNNHAIRKIDVSGEVSTFAGGNDSGYVDGPGISAKFNSPAGITYCDGYLYVSDFHNHLIRKISISTREVGTFAGTVGGGFLDGPALSAKFSSPYGICTDKRGNFFISDRKNHNIRKIDSKGIVSTFAGSIQGNADGTGSSAQFNMPVGLDIDSVGNIYVADMLNNRIRKIDKQGNVTTIAGSFVGFEDGLREDIKFNHPTDVKIAPDGSLFISDYGNYSIRKLTFKNPFWIEWWFKVIELLALMLLVIFSIIIVYNRKLKREREKNKQLSQTYDLEIKAIKAQMNPHFIFNSLNSIQKFILSDDNENAFKYLSMFSKLVRKLLESNTTESISLEDEIDLLTKYIEMESLRFKHSFKYSINSDEEIIPSKIKIPHMLIQPFVENAIWHGLMHKQDNRILQISFSLLDPKRLICVVEDNGAGRFHSKKSESIEKKSLGIDFIKQRFALMAKTLDLQCGITIIDKKNNSGESEGTKVEIITPVFT